MEVFWRVLPRNYPPPKWDDHGAGALNRAKANNRNWILVWEDGFCDFYECERAGSGYIKGRFGADVFFKMSHEVYNYGEGLVGKVAADNSHKWVFGDSSNENDPTFISSWNVSIDPVVEDLNLVISIQRKFSYLQSIPGIYAIQRPYLPSQHPYTFKPNNPHIMLETNEKTFIDEYKCQLAGSKRQYVEEQNDSPVKSINLGHNSPQNGVAELSAIWSIPPLFPPMSCSLGALLTKLPSVVPSDNATEALESPLENKSTGIKSGSYAKVDDSGGVAQEAKQSTLNPNLGLVDEVGVKLGSGPLREDQSAVNLN
ncbi:unnamed protein product [Ilex paraguariensis]|uniref:Transcription factor MYC/MYB N-terminal domain-containing protein n=1 Tax=Ilex paraguariensis TaxID=185542 RepID=A0ABC8QSY9_9AQUA